MQVGNAAVDANDLLEITFMGPMGSKRSKLSLLFLVRIN
jgi:hypothetical protein